MNDLEILARKFGTDKQVGDGSIPECHGYTDVYYELFKDHREDYTDILELGVWFGASHLMWQEFFKNSEIYGVDNYFGLAHKFHTDNPEWTDEQIQQKLYEELDSIRDKGIGIIIAEQTDKDTIEGIFDGADFDLVIDDGGHGAWQQQASFGFLWSHVKPGGYYIIEDLGVGLQREFRQYDDPRSSTPYWLNSMIAEDPFSYYIPTEKLQEILKEIEYIKYEGELGIIKKNG